MTFCEVTYNITVKQYDNWMHNENQFPVHHTGKTQRFIIQSSRVKQVRAQLLGCAETILSNLITCQNVPPSMYVAHENKSLLCTINILSISNMKDVQTIEPYQAKQLS